MCASCCAGRTRARAGRTPSTSRCRATSASSTWSRPSYAPRSSTPPSGGATVPWCSRHRPGRMRELRPAPPRPQRPLLEASRDVPPRSVGAAIRAVRAWLCGGPRARGRYCRGRRGCEGRLPAVEGSMTRTYTTRDWLDSIFNLKELLSLTENELAVLEEIDGDLILKAEWWRRRRRREA